MSTKRARDAERIMQGETKPGIFRSWWAPVAFVTLAMLFYSAVGALIWILWRVL